MFESNLLFFYIRGKKERGKHFRKRESQFLFPVSQLSSISDFPLSLYFPLFLFCLLLFTLIGFILSALFFARILFSAFQYTARNIFASSNFTKAISSSEYDRQYLLRDLNSYLAAPFSKEKCENARRRMRKK